VFQGENTNGTTPLIVYYGTVIGREITFEVSLKWQSWQQKRDDHYAEHS
jgi:hypothetical protein